MTTQKSQPKLPEVLLIGCQGSGKTVLASLLKQQCDKPAESKRAKESKEPKHGVSFATSSTTGLNRTELAAKIPFALLEVGGPMRTTWPSYFADRALVVFTIDRSNRSQVAVAGFELYNALRSDKLQHIPVVVVLTKSDVEDGMSRHELQSLIRLDDAVVAAAQTSSPLTVLETSSAAGTGIAELLETVVQLLGASKAAGATASAAVAARTENGVAGTKT